MSKALDVLIVLFTAHVSILKQNKNKIKIKIKQERISSTTL